jgi:O-antigen/teichoic acid export membrane protein
MDLRQRTVRGIGWSATSQITKLLMQLVVTAILARLLTPSDFGLIAMVVVFSSFVGIFSDLGLSSAIVQKKGINDELLSSSFWINVGLGSLLTISFAVVAPLIAVFYSEQRLVPIIVVLSTIFFISSFGNVQTALLTKRMNFKALAIISIIATGVAGAISIFLAFSGYGVWSLVWNAVVAALFTVIFSWIFSRWIPRLSFKLQEIKGVIRYGSNLTGFSFVNYFSRNLDNLLIGKFLGPASLGFYNLAYNFLLLPLTNISAVIGNVMFPALSIIQDEKKLVGQAYVTANRHIASISFPLMMWLVIVAPQLIRVVFGPKWESSILLVQILAFAGMNQSIVTNNGWIFMSQGRTDILFKWGIFATIVYAISFIVGLRWNVEGVATAYTIAGYAIAYPAFAIPFRLINLKFGYFLVRLKTIIFATSIFAIIMFSTRVFLERLSGVQDIAVLLVVTSIGALSYIGLIFLLDKDLFRETLSLLSEFRLLRSDLTED